MQASSMMSMKAGLPCPNFRISHRKLSGWPEMMSRFERDALPETGLGSLKSSCDGGLKVGHYGIGAVGQVMVLDSAKVGLNGVELGALGRQVVPGDAFGGQRRTGLLNDPADVNRGIVEYDHQRRPQASEGAHKDQQVLGGQAVGNRPPPERGCGTVRKQAPPSY